MSSSSNELMMFMLAEVVILFITINTILVAHDSMEEDETIDDNINGLILVVVILPNAASRSMVGCEVFPSPPPLQHAMGEKRIRCI